MPTVLAIFAMVGVTISLFGGWQKRLKDRLSVVYDRLALKHEVARMGSFEWSVPDDRFEASPEMNRVYGIGPANQIRTSAQWTALIYPEDWAETRAALDAAVGRKGTPFDATFRIVRALRRCAGFTAGAGCITMAPANWSTYWESTWTSLS